MRVHGLPAARGHILNPLGQDLPVITQIIAAPAAGIGAGTPVTVTFSTTPGPPLLVNSVPSGALGAAVPVTVLMGTTLVPVPAPGLGAGALALVTFALPPPPIRPARTWERDFQRFAVTNERERHAEALWQYGELVVFALLWTTVDMAAGLAVRCPRCFTNSAAVDNENAIAAAYGQGNQYKCGTCFGSQFVAAGNYTASPGLRALLVRPAILSDMDKAQQWTAKGVMNTGQLNAESTPDFRVRNGDYLLRQDGTRFRLRVPRRATLRTGFAPPYQETAAITYNQSAAALEDPSSVAYIIPPDPETLAAALAVYTRLPVSYEWEIQNGPLIPEEAPPAAARGALQPSAVIQGAVLS